MISIYRNITKVADVEPATSSNYIETLMGEHQVTLVFELSVFVELLIGDYITYEGVKYTINKLPTVTKTSTKSYQYNAVFQHPRYDMLKVMYMLFDNTATPAQGEFSLTGTADTFVDLLVANMNRISSGWVKGTVIESEYKKLTFTNENCHSVLERLAQEFDTEFHVINKTVYLEKQATQRELTLEYGSTAYDIERLSVNSEDVVTRIYPFGSDKNLSSQYRGGSSKLLIPSPNSYLESANVAAYGIIEQAKTFEDIYPRLSLLGAGVVTSVGDKYTFSDSALDFDVNACLMPGVPAMVLFLTGECAGYDFEIKLYNHSTKTFVIIENSKDEDLVLPTDLLRPAVNDKYVLLDVVMPDAYVQAAEAELLTRALEFLIDNDTAKVSYRVTFSSLYAKQSAPVIQCSDQVRVYDQDLGVDEYIRITKLQKGIRDGHNIQIDLSNTVTRSPLQRINGDIKSINNQVIVSNQRNKQRGIEAYQRNRELQQMVFDPDGYFDNNNIRPLSIETSMLSVGAKSQQYQLTCLLQPNYNANPQSMYWSAGLLTHFSLVDDQIKEWVIASGNITITGDNQTRPLYIYARCLRVGSTGDIYVSENAIKFNSEASYWYFLVGILHTPVSDVRGISLSYGQTTINGQFIRTGVISSPDGATYFNVTTGEIAGKILFKDGLISAMIGMSEDGENIISGLDGGSSNIGFWTGGSYTDALANIAKIILRKDGSGQLAGGNLSWDLLGKLLFGKIGDSETIKISTDSIPDLAEINNREEYSLPVLNEQIVKDLNNPAHAGINVNSDYINEFVLENDSLLTVDAAVGYAVGVDIIGFGYDGFLYLEKFNGSSWVVVETAEAVDTYAIGVSFYQLSVTKGRFRVRWHITCGYSYVNGPSATINLDKYCSINFKLIVNKLVIGIDGIALFDSMTDKFLRLSLKDNVAQLRMKLDTDMPGVLLAGDGNTGGGGSIRFGAKRHETNTVEKLSGTGYYRVWHSIGHSAYTVQLTMKASGLNAMWENPNNSYFDVRIYSGTTPANANFSFVAFGDN